MSLLVIIQLVENDKLRNGNREALTALRKRARTTKSSVASPFESIMKGVAGTTSRPLVQEVCTTCGNHDSSEQTWMMFPGTDLFARIPFHAAHTILETGSSLTPFHVQGRNACLAIFFTSVFVGVFYVVVFCNDL